MALRVVQGLESKNFTVWIAPRDIRPGEIYAQSILEAINSCKIFIVILSQHSNQSNQVLKEVDRAVDRGKIIIPFRIENVIPSKALEYYLCNTQWCDAFKGNVDNYIEILSDICLGYLTTAKDVYRHNLKTSQQISKSRGDDTAATIIKKRWFLPQAEKQKNEQDGNILGGDRTIPEYVDFKNLLKMPGKILKKRNEEVTKTDITITTTMVTNSVVAEPLESFQPVQTVFQSDNKKSLASEQQNAHVKSRVNLFVVRFKKILLVSFCIFFMLLYFIWDFFDSKKYFNSHINTFNKSNLKDQSLKDSSYEKNLPSDIVDLNKDLCSFWMINSVKELSQVKYLYEDILLKNGIVLQNNEVFGQDNFFELREKIYTTWLHDKSAMLEDYYKVFLLDRVMLDKKALTPLGTKIFAIHFDKNFSDSTSVALRELELLLYNDIIELINSVDVVRVIEKLNSKNSMPINIFFLSSRNDAFPTGSNVDQKTTKPQEFTLDIKPIEEQNNSVKTIIVRINDEKDHFKKVGHEKIISLEEKLFFKFKSLIIDGE